METLNKDLNLLNAGDQNKGQGSLLEIVGFDVDTSYGDMKETVLRNDKNAISVGGQSSVGPNQQFQIRFTDQDSLLDLGSACLTGRLHVPADADPNYAGNCTFNMVQFFKGIYCKVGGVQMSFADSDVYQQLILRLTNRAELEAFSDGAWHNISRTNTGFGVVTGYTPIIQEQLFTAFNRLKGGSVLNDGNAIYGNGAAGGDCNFVIPLWMIFPWIKTIPDMTLYTSMGQTIEFSIQTALTTDCMFRYGGDHLINVNYDLQNMGILYQYTRLDSARNEMVLKSQFAFHPTIIQNYKIGPATPQLNANFAVSKGEKLKRLVWGYASNQSQSTGNNVATNVQIFGSNPYSSRTAQAPKIKHYLIELNAGGDRVILNCNDFAILQHYQATNTYNSDYGYAGGNAGLIKDVQCAYALDISRYSRDLIGATSKAQIQLVTNFQISLDERLVISTDTTVPTAADLAHLDFYAYLEKSAPVYLKNGVYSHANI